MICWKRFEAIFRHRLYSNGFQGNWENTIVIRNTVGMSANRRTFGSTVLQYNCCWWERIRSALGLWKLVSVELSDFRSKVNEVQFSSTQNSNMLHIPHSKVQPYIPHFDNVIFEMCYKPQVSLRLFISKISR